MKQQKPQKKQELFNFSQSDINAIAKTLCGKKAVATADRREALNNPEKLYFPAELAQVDAKTLLLSRAALDSAAADIRGASMEIRNSAPAEMSEREKMVLWYLTKIRGESLLANKFKGAGGNMKTAITRDVNPKMEESLNFSEIQGATANRVMECVYRQMMGYDHLNHPYMIESMKKIAPHFPAIKKIMEAVNRRMSKENAKKTLYDLSRKMSTIVTEALEPKKDDSDGEGDGDGDGDGDSKQADGGAGGGDDTRSDSGKPSSDGKKSGGPGASGGSTEPPPPSDGAGGFDDNFKTTDQVLKDSLNDKVNDVAPEQMNTSGKHAARIQYTKQVFESDDANNSIKSRFYREAFKSSHMQTLMKALDNRSLKRPQYVGNKKSGVIIGSRDLIRAMVCGDSDIFYRKKVSKPRGANVVLLQDFSGSMGGERKNHAAAAIEAIACACNRYGHKVLVGGFGDHIGVKKGNVIQKIRFSEQADRIRPPSGSSYSSLFITKDFSDPYVRGESYKFQSRLAYGGTPLADPIKALTRHLLENEIEEARVLLLSDGQCNELDQIKMVLDQSTKICGAKYSLVMVVPYQYDRYAFGEKEKKDFHDWKKRTVGYYHKWYGCAVSLSISPSRVPYDLSAALARMGVVT